MEAIYDVEVTTGSMTHAGTFDNIFITLIGTQGVSERTKLDSYGRDFKTGMKVKYKVITRFTLANLLLIRLEKDHFMFLPENDWFCSLVNVRTPEKDVIHFPCYRWMGEGEVIELREEKYSQLKEHRRNELKLNKQVYQWTEYKTGLPQHAFFQEPLSLPSVVRFSFTKDMDSAFNCSTALGEIKMKKLVKKTDQWIQMEDMKSAFWSSRTAVSEYVHLHWMDDDFFGYQLLNGSHPMMVRRCTELPLNFAVTNGMVQPFLESGTSLTLEMKQGNIFLCDYKRLADLSTQFINGKQQYVAAPLCLLYKNQVGKLLPIAIQVHLMGFINLRQYWFPNAPGSLKQPPPTSKGSSDKSILLDTLPDMNTSAYLVSVFWLLSKPSSDLVSLGQYPEDYFCQMAPQKRIRDFQAELSFFSEAIKDRNKGLQVPYTYMCPDNISNSVSI
uniref:Uncharacterized protein n=1 Tax=Cyprinus carpio TaxID=7962 RepID=A0A8C2GE95_CYPCA